MHDTEQRELDVEDYRAEEMSGAFADWPEVLQIEGTERYTAEDIIETGRAYGFVPDNPFDHSIAVALLDHEVRHADSEGIDPQEWRRRLIARQDHDDAAGDEDEQRRMDAEDRLIAAYEDYHS